jgi:hypothetical protein
VASAGLRQWWTPLLLGAATLAIVASGCRRHRRVHARRTTALAPGPLAPDVVAFTDELSDRVTDRLVGLGGWRSIEYATYERLARRLDRDTAIRLLADRRPAIRTWAAKHVLEHLPADGPHVLPLTRDRATIRAQSGCVRSTPTVAAWVVGTIVEQRRRDLLASVAEDPQVAIPERVQALAALGPSEAGVVGRVAKALLDQPGAHHASVLMAIRKTRAPNVVALVWPFVKSESAVERGTAAEALALVPTPEAAATLLTMTTDPAPSVRLQARLAYLASLAGDSPTKQRLLAECPWGEVLGSRASTCFAGIAELGTEAVPSILDAATASERTLAITVIPPTAIEGSPCIRTWLRGKVARATPTAPAAAGTKETWQNTEASAALEALARSPALDDAEVARPFLQSGNPVERHAAAQVVLAGGGAADVERVLADGWFAPEAAERLFWLRSYGSIATIRAAGKTSSSRRLEHIAVDLERLRDGQPPSLDDLPPRISVEPVAIDCLGVVGGAAALRRELPEIRSAYRELVARGGAPTGDLRLTLFLDGRGAVDGVVADPRADERLATLARVASQRMRFQVALFGQCTTTLRFQLGR